MPGLEDKDTKFRISNIVTTMNRIHKISISALLMYISGALFAQAQETTATEAATAAATDVTLLGMFAQGGWAMYPLTLFSMGMLGLIIYNAITVREKPLLMPEVLNDEIGPRLQNMDVVGALEVCQENPGPITNILACGLETTTNGNIDLKNFDDAVSESASIELARPYVFINYLQVIASVSPMVGLLGTVSGMVKAFRGIATQGMGKPELLANNISEALITTASGLIVAVPALIAYFYFKNKYGKITSGVSQVIGRTLRTLVRQADTPGH